MLAKRLLSLLPYPRATATTSSCCPGWIRTGKLQDRAWSIPSSLTTSPCFTANRVAAVGERHA